MTEPDETLLEIHPALTNLDPESVTPPIVELKPENAIPVQEPVEPLPENEISDDTEADAPRSVVESIEIEPLSEMLPSPVEPLAPAEPAAFVPMATDATWRLRIRPYMGDETTRELDGSTIAIGRSDANDITISQDRQLSRHHARIAVEEGVWMLTDLSSKNGSTVNGTLAQRCALEHGDLIQLGESVFVFEQEVELPRVSVDMPAPAAAPAPAVDSGAHDRRLDPLIEIGEMLACAEEELGVLDETVSRMRDVLQADRVVLYLVEEGQSKPLMQYASEDTRTGDNDLAAEVIMELAMAAEEPVVDSMTGSVARHVAILPLHARYRKVGVLVAERGPAGEPFADRDVQIGRTATTHITSFLRSVL